MLNATLEQYIKGVSSVLEEIPEERKLMLLPVVNYLQGSLSKNHDAKLLFVCTHNSRRSLFAQVWAQVAAWKNGVKNFQAFSAGDSVTAVHPNTRDALIRAGVQTKTMSEGDNPLYKAVFDNEIPSPILFSKDIDYTELPKKNFGAVLVCVEDAETCPFIPNAEVRIPLPYNDPKKFDDTTEMKAAYDRCCLQIATEMFWVMKNVSEEM